MCNIGTAVVASYFPWRLEIFSRDVSLLIHIPVGHTNVAGLVELPDEPDVFEEVFVLLRQAVGRIPVEFFTFLRGNENLAF